MKQIRHTFYASLAMTAILGSFIIGCQAPPTTQPVTYSPQETLALANQALATSVSTLNQLRAAGLISNGDWTNIKLAVTAASNALDAWQQHLSDSQTAQYIAAYQAAIVPIAQLIQNVTKKNPTTQP